MQSNQGGCKIENFILMKVLFILLPVVYLAGNGYLFLRVWQSMSCLPVWGKVIVAVLFWLTAFSLFAAIGLRDVQIPDLLLKCMYWIGSVWMAFLLYMVLLLAVFDVAGFFVPALKHSLLFALPLTLCFLCGGYINYRYPRVEHIGISLDKQQEVSPVRIAAISDVHLGYGTSVSALKRYVKLVNAQNPDLVLIAGDLIDNSIRPLLHDSYAEALAELNAPMGIYMVPGNHEYISGIDACAEFIADTKVRMLRDSIVTLPGGLQIIGRDDMSNRNRKPLEELMEGTDSTRPLIVLDHQPYDLAGADSLGVDIQISGHTHRGQIWPLNWLTDCIFEQSHGYRKWTHSHIYVSSGLSLWGPPFRIGTHSDMAVIKVL